MKPLTTKKAFEQIINKRGIYKDLGMTESAVTSLRHNYKQGKITLDKMERILALAGAKVIQEKLWQLR